MSFDSLRLSFKGPKRIVSSGLLGATLALLVSGCSDSAMQNNANSQTESSNQEAKSESPDKTENQAEKSAGSNVEVPSELSDNQEVKAYFRALQKVNDEYASMIEKMAKNTKESKEEGGMSYGDAMENMQDMAASAKKMAPLTKKMDSLKQKRGIMKGELTPAEKKAFSKAYGKIMRRYMEMSMKMQSNMN